MKHAISIVAALTISCFAMADILEVRAVGRQVSAEDLGDGPDFNGYVVDLYLVSDDPTDTSLNVFGLTLTNSVNASVYYQSSTSPGWTPSSVGNYFETDARRFADSFVSLGGRLLSGRPVRHENGAIVQMQANGTSLDPSFGGEATPAPQQDAGWFNFNPTFYIGQPVGGLVFIARFAIEDVPYFELHGEISCAWNNGIGTELGLHLDMPIDSGSQFLDCNENGIPDNVEIAEGLAEDCNGNLLLDACELAAGAPDENRNGILDECEQSYGDLDLNGLINGVDFGILIAQFGESGGMDHVVGDLDDNGEVRGNDLGLLLVRWDDQ